MENEYRSLAKVLNYELCSKRYMGPDDLIMLENQPFLNSHSVHHHIALDIFLQRKVFGPIWSRYETREMDLVSYIFPQLANEGIMSLETSYQHNEFAREGNTASKTGCLIGEHILSDGSVTSNFNYQLHAGFIFF